MITTAEEPRNGSRVIRIAIGGSVLVHAVFVVLVLLAGSQLGHLLARITPQTVPTRPPQDEIITISSAARIAPKANPVRPAPPQRVVQSRPPPRPPQRVAVQSQTITQPTYQPPPGLKHELSRQDLHAPRQPSKSATASPQPRQIAYRPPAPNSLPQRKSPQLTREQIARMDQEFAKTIAQTRSLVNPLRVNPDPAAAPKRYRIQLAGVLGHLHHGQGIYYPIKGWRSGGFDYYYVAYEFTYPDGTLETGNVPWPIHFAPNDDPFVSPDVGMLQRTPLPPPPAGFVPPGDLGKALRYYFPNMQFEEKDN
jgi:hypothetical protein